MRPAAGPDVLVRRAGDVPVQIQRTVRRERYLDDTPTPGGARFAIGGGEHSILEQYLRAIETAKRAIYVEDQAIGAPAIVDALRGALERGVEVTVLVPADPNRDMAAGVLVQIEGIGKRFSGAYYVMSTEHSYRPGTGYRTVIGVRRNAA